MFQVMKNKIKNGQVKQLQRNGRKPNIQIAFWPDMCILMSREVCGSFWWRRWWWRDCYWVHKVCYVSARQAVSDLILTAEGGSAIKLIDSWGNCPLKRLSNLPSLHVGGQSLWLTWAPWWIWGCLWLYSWGPKSNVGFSVQIV